MDSFSDDSFVDDELFIGPVTTEYTKKLLLQKPQLSDDSKRKTFSGVPTPVDDLIDSSEYYTPDSISSRSNANFLDKMQAMLDEPSSSNISCKTMNDKSIVKQRRSSLPKQMDETSKLQQSCNNVISETETDDYLRYQGTQIKYENISATEIEDYDDETSLESFKKVETDSLDACNSDTDICLPYSLDSAESSYVSYQEDFLQYEKSYIVENNDISSAPDSPTNETSFEGNTSYTMSSTDSFKESNLMPPTNQFKRELPRTPVQTGREVLKQKNVFVTPTSQSLKKAKPKKSSDKFKHVQSPVSFYIKNSATAAIRRNVQTTAKLPAILPNHFFEDIPDISHRWEFSIPQVIYKPSVVQQPKGGEIYLARNIQTLMPTVANMYMTKHEKRIKGSEDTQENISRKLYEDMDLTVGHGSSAASAQDISIIQVKPYF